MPVDAASKQSGNLIDVSPHVLCGMRWRATRTHRLVEFNAIQLQNCSKPSSTCGIVQCEGRLHNFTIAAKLYSIIVSVSTNHPFTMDFRLVYFYPDFTGNSQRQSFSSRQWRANRNSAESKNSTEDLKWSSEIRVLYEMSVMERAHSTQESFRVCLCVRAWPI